MRFARLSIAAMCSTLVATAFGVMIFPALAIVKCTHNGSVEYTDGECVTARVMPPLDLRQPQSLNADRADASRRAAAEKAELERLENARHRSEQQIEKQQLRQRSAIRLRHQRCEALLLRKKWLEEDRRAATSRSNKSISKKSRRLAEKYALECGGLA